MNKSLMLRSNKGIVESGVLVILLMTLAVAGKAGLIYGGGSPATSGIIVSASVLTAYSQMPHVVEDFRHRKANDICGYDCATGMTDNEIMNVIRDDAPGVLNRVMFMEANPGWRLGG